MPDELIPLAVFLQPPPASTNAPEPEEEAVVLESPAIETIPDEPSDELDETLSAVRRFRAALADALDAAVETLLHDIAADVLVRELKIAPADVALVVKRARERFAFEEPLLVRVHPAELAPVAALGLNARGDERLRRGDVLIELRSGTIDVTLGARLAAVLGT